MTVNGKNRSRLGGEMGGKVTMAEESLWRFSVMAIGTLSVAIQVFYGVRESSGAIRWR
jgi:hypothetical protein